MAKILKGRFLASILVIFSIVVILSFGLIDDQVLGFEIPVPPQLSVTNVPNPSIFCAISAEVDVLDANGKVIATEKSPFFNTNPITTFSFIDVKKTVDVSGFKVTPKIKCQSGGNLDAEGVNPNTGTIGLIPSIRIPLTIKSGELFVKVFSVSADKSKLIETYNGKINTSQLDLINSKEKFLGTHTIEAERILVFADDGNYDSIQHIVIEGDINLIYKDFSTVNYQIKLETKESFSGENRISIDNPIINFRNISIEKGEVGDSGGTTGGKTPEDCKKNEVFLNSICVPISGSPSTTPPISVGLATDFLDEFLFCLVTNPDKGCLTNQNFAPIYIAGFGLVAVLIASFKKPREEIYGVQNI